jgi:imidazolonepropionase-like amidohydrolase
MLRILLPLCHYSLMHRLTMLFVLLVAGCDQPPPAPFVTQVPFEPDSGNVSIRCGVLIDGVADEPFEDQLVIIRDGRFERISEFARPPEDIVFLDLGDFTCMPGLINTHVHLMERPEDSVDYGLYYDRSLQDHVDITLAMGAANLLTGFTTVRNVGDFATDPIYIGRDMFRDGSAIGPRVQTAGPYLTIPGGGGTVDVPYRDASEIPPELQKGVAVGPDEFSAKAEHAIAEGAEFLKVIASGAVFSFGIAPGAPEMTREEIAAVVAVAQRHGLKVTAHVHSAQSAIDAVTAGVDTLEHASLLNDEALALVKANGVSLSMDVYNGTYTDTVGREQGYPEEYLQRNADTTGAQRVVFEKAYALGIPILYGTDAGVLPHDMGGWQFGIMVERGMTPMDALRSAMSVAAEHMGWEDKVGSIKPGLYGDLIAVKGNPLEDQDTMKDVQVVIKGGRAFKLPGE